MSPPAQDLPGALAARDTGEAIGLRALILIAHEERREQMRLLLARLAPNSQIEIPTSVLDVLRRLARAPFDLLVLDHSIEGVAGAALVRHLARAAPSVVVVAFDEIGQSTAEQDGALWPWSEAEVALRRVIERRRLPGTQGN